MNLEKEKQSRNDCRIDFSRLGAKTVPRKSSPRSEQAHSTEDILAWPDTANSYIMKRIYALNHS